MICRPSGHHQLSRVTLAAGFRDRTANKDCQTLPENCQTLEKDQALQLQNTNHFKGKIWCPEADSNHRHADFQSAALPTELSGRRCLSLSASALLWQLQIAVQRKSAKFILRFRGARPARPGCDSRRATSAPDRHRRSGASKKAGIPERRACHRSGSASDRLLPGQPRQRDTVALAIDFVKPHRGPADQHRLGGLAAKC